MCACMRTRFVVEQFLLCFVLTGHISCWGKKTKHSCCLVTSLWLHIIYYTFLLLCQTFTKYDILFLLVSLCIIQSKMPYLASIFLYRCSITSYQVMLLFCLSFLFLCVHGVGDVHYLQKPIVTEGTTAQITTFIPKGQSIIPQSTNGELTKSDCLLTSASKIAFISLFVSLTCTLS